MVREVHRVRMWAGLMRANCKLCTVQAPEALHTNDHRSLKAKASWQISAAGSTWIISTCSS